jgi:hypothetical protein
VSTIMLENRHGSAWNNEKVPTSSW